MYDLVDTEASNVEEFLSYVRAALSEHVPDVVRPPHRPLVVVGPFGTKKRVLLQQLFEQLPGCFVAPAITTTRETPNPEVRIGDVQHSPLLCTLLGMLADTCTCSQAFLHTHTCIRTCANTCVHTHVHSHTRTHRYVCTHQRAHTRTHTTCAHTMCAHARRWMTGARWWW